jgi:hypothetical protein
MVICGSGFLRFMVAWRPYHSFPALLAVAGIAWIAAPDDAVMVAATTDIDVGVALHNGFVAETQPPWGRTSCALPWVRGLRGPSVRDETVSCDCRLLSPRQKSNP